MKLLPQRLEWTLLLWLSCVFSSITAGVYYGTLHAPFSPHGSGEAPCLRSGTYQDLASHTQNHPRMCVGAKGGESGGNQVDPIGMNPRS